MIRAELSSDSYATARRHRQVTIAGPGAVQEADRGQHLRGRDTAQRLPRQNAMLAGVRYR